MCSLATGMTGMGIEFLTNLVLRKFHVSAFLCCFCSSCCSVFLLSLCWTSANSYHPTFLALGVVSFLINGRLVELDCSQVGLVVSFLSSSIRALSSVLMTRFAMELSVIVV